MHSELFSLFGLQIQMYGVMLARGFLACDLLGGLLARLSGRNPRDVDTLVMVAAVCGVLGARAVYVWQNWRTEFASAPLEMFAVWRGGLVFYGGFGAAVAGLTSEAPAAEVAAEVQVRLGVQLTAQDVAAWRRMVIQGDAKAEALRMVVAYRRAAGGER